MLRYRDGEVEIRTKPKPSGNFQLEVPELGVAVRCGGAGPRRQTSSPLHRSSYSAASLILQNTTASALALSPKAPLPSAAMSEAPIVLDGGTGFLKAGFAGQVCPCAPTCCECTLTCTG
jgi:hypothetical protein